MIDWWWVGTNTLWILGLAVLLAIGGYSSYQQAQRGASARPESFEVDKSLLARIGALLLCLGLAFSGGSWLEQALWGIVAFVLLVDTLVSVGRRQVST